MVKSRIFQYSFVELELQTYHCGQTNLIEVLGWTSSLVIFDIFHFSIKKIKFFNGDAIECHQVLHLLLQSGRLLPGFESSHLLKILFNDGEFLFSLLDQPLKLSLISRSILTNLAAWSLCSSITTSRFGTLQKK